MSIELVAKIAVSGIPYALDKPYDYLVPAEFTKLAVPGARVIVPFSRSNRRTEGLILSVSSELSKQRKLKSIIEFLDSEPIMQNEQLKLALWMRSRFFCTVYDAIKAMIPAGLWYKSGKLSIRDKTIKMVELIIPAEDAMVLADTKRRTAPSQAKVLSTLCSVGYVSLNELKEFTGAGMQGIKALERSAYISIAEEIVFRRPQINVLSENAPLPELSFDQLSVFESIGNNITDEKLKIGLLFGVTGSGKTAVYLHLIEKMLKAGKSSILLLPEISLTPQMVQTFYSHFGDIVAILHSSLSAGERYDEASFLLLTK